MKGNEPTNRVRPLFEMGSELPPAPEVKQEIGNRKEEAKRVVKRLYAIFEDHREAAGAWSSQQHAIQAEL